MIFAEEEFALLVYSQVLFYHFVIHSCTSCRLNLIGLMQFLFVYFVTYKVQTVVVLNLVILIRFGLGRNPEWVLTRFLKDLLNNYPPDQVSKFLICRTFGPASQCHDRRGNFIEQIELSGLNLIERKLQSWVEIELKNWM